LLVTHPRNLFQFCQVSIPFPNSASSFSLINIPFPRRGHRGTDAIDSLRTSPTFFRCSITALGGWDASNSSNAKGLRKSQLQPDQRLKFGPIACPKLRVPASLCGSADQARHVSTRRQERRTVLVGITITAISIAAPDRTCDFCMHRQFVGSSLGKSHRVARSTDAELKCSHSQLPSRSYGAYKWLSNAGHATRFRFHFLQNFARLQKLLLQGTYIPVEFAETIFLEHGLKNAP
jgi:hypothetical protein